MNFSRRYFKNILFEGEKNGEKISINSCYGADGEIKLSKTQFETDSLNTKWLVRCKVNILLKTCFFSKL